MRCRPIVARFSARCGTPLTCSFAIAPRTPIRFRNLRAQQEQGDADRPAALEASASVYVYVDPVARVRCKRCLIVRLFS
jgi:hypothetical protein